MSGNVLPTYASEEMVRAAVAKSGLPVQTTVAHLLAEAFEVEEEWSFVDRNEGKLRTLDVHARWWPHRWIPRGKQPHADPIVDLLVECKQSEAPYVFVSSQPGPLHHWPAVAGLRRDRIAIRTDDSVSTYHYSVIHALGLRNEPFLVRAPAYSRFVSKALPIKGGAQLEYGGSAAYNESVEPLMSALQYFRKSVEPIPSFVYFNCHAAFTVCVLAAPMVFVHPEGDDLQLSMQPWVRLLRNEAVPTAHPFDRAQGYAVDFVHVSFLPTYVTDHVLPFASAWADRVVALHEVVAAGTGFAAAFDRADEDEGLARLRPLRSVERATEWPLLLLRRASQELTRARVARSRRGARRARREA